MSVKSKQKSSFFAALIHRAYLPKEIPPVVTARYFAAYCQNQYTFLNSELAAFLKLSTKHDTFTAPRPEAGRRNLAIVHPLGQLAVSLLITNHRSAIKTLIAANGTSYYRSSESNDQTIALEGLDFEAWRASQLRLYAEYPVALKADISRFFYTVYTHSIPWAVLGKEKAKSWFFGKNPKLKKHWANQLDIALQCCNSRETFGIPVGPDTSRIIAEILLSGIEMNTDFNQVVTKHKVIRLVDDFLIGFEDEASAASALTSLRTALWAFNLQLNENKTAIVRTSLMFEESWRLEFQHFRISEINSNDQRKDIRKIADQALRYCQEYKSGLPANWATSRLSKLKALDDNFVPVLDVLLRFARDFPSTIVHLCAFVINNQSKCGSGEAHERVSINLKRLILLHWKHQHDQEISWCLLAASVLGVTIDESDIPEFETVPNATVLAVLGLMKERKLLNFPMSKWAWRQKLKESGVLGPYWLPYYESVRRGWTKDKLLEKEVNAHKVLASMLANKVTFLDFDIMSAKSINLKKLVYTKKAKHLNAAVTLGIEDSQIDQYEEEYIFDIGDYG
jgi:Reverse transcriptase (RNA-dependent DNA polymerase)